MKFHMTYKVPILLYSPFSSRTSYLFGNSFFYILKKTILKWMAGERRSQWGKDSTLYSISSYINKNIATFQFPFVTTILLPSKAVMYVFFFWTIIFVFTVKSSEVFPLTMTLLFSVKNSDSCCRNLKLIQGDSCFQNFPLNIFMQTEIYSPEHQKIFGGTSDCRHYLWFVVLYPWSRFVSLQLSNNYKEF